MIDIEKERENYETLCKKMGLVRALQKTDGEYVNDHAQTAWGGWLLCVGLKQAEIDDLKAQLNALEESRMNWREYVQKIESGEYVLISKQCPDPEFADALFDLLDQHAFGEVGQDKFISYSDIDEEKVYALVVNSTQKTKPQKCVWRNVQNELWHSECGEEHLLDQEFYETITEHLTYCFKCGKKIEEVSLESEDD